MRPAVEHFTSVRAVRPEPEAHEAEGSGLGAPEKVKRWLVRKLKLIDAAVEYRITRWGTGD